MGFFSLLLIAVALSLDSFAVSICKGLKMRKVSLKKVLIIATYFALFQGGMPVIGYYLGSSFESLITSIDHWIAFGLLFVIGVNMFREGLSKEKTNVTDGIGFKEMIVFSLATSIDALATGISFAFLEVNILVAALLIGSATFILSVLGIFVGNKFGKKYEKFAQIIGGIILIVLGLKILFEHLGFL